MKSINVSKSKSNLNKIIIADDIALDTATFKHASKRDIEKNMKRETSSDKNMQQAEKKVSNFSFIITSKYSLLKCVLGAFFKELLLLSSSSSQVNS